MVLTVGLLVILAVPSVVWVAMHTRRNHRTGQKVQAPGPKHRWWQP